MHTIVSCVVCALIYTCIITCSDYQREQKGYEELVGLQELCESSISLLSLFRQLSLVEFELYEMSPVMFTLYGEEFVDSINDLLKEQMVNSSVVGVLVCEVSDEPSTM